MDFNDPIFQKIFFEVHSGLPREGPGDESSLRRALSLVSGLPPNPRILDIGCGPGTQTLGLLDATSGLVLGLDNHFPFVRELAGKIAAGGLQGRALAVRGDMNQLGIRPQSLDLIWCEGAAYIMGVASAFNSWGQFLKPGGWLAVTEAVWLKPHPPEPVRKLWEEYPDIKNIPANLGLIAECGYKVAGHFTLPNSAWWDQYYTPMEKRLAELKRSYVSNPQALEILAYHQNEINIYRQYSEYYGYEFFVCQSKERLKGHIT
jgi:SAM-dependent methyltransferase